MKKFSWAIVALALLFVRGWAVESYNKLPMFGGVTNLQNWVGTNTTYISVNVWQSDDDGNTIGYYLNAVDYAPSSFADMKAKLWQTIVDTANLYVKSGQYNPAYKVYTYCGTLREEYIPFDDQDFGVLLAFNKAYGTEITISNGKVDRPSVEATPINFVRDAGFRFDTKAQSVTIKVNGVEQPDGAYVGTDRNVEGGVFIKSEYLTSSSVLELSVTFRDGTTLDYDGGGNLKGDYTPRLEIRIVDGAPLIEVKGLLPNQTVELEYSTDMIHWYPYPGKVRAIRPAALPKEEAKFFRIKDQ